MQAEWVLDDNSRVPLACTERLLIPATEVECVEFEKLAFTQEDVDSANAGAALMIEYNRKIEESKASQKKEEDSDEDSKLPKGNGEGVQANNENSYHAEIK